MAQNQQNPKKNDSIRLGEHEICILFQLNEKVTLTCSHLLKLCFQGRGKGSVYKVLSRLKQLGYIQVVSYDLGRKGKLEDVHMITSKGWHCLAQAIMIDEAQSPYLSKTSPNVLVDYVHRMAIIHYWIDLELELQKDPQFELSLFVPEFKRLDNGKTITLKYETDGGITWQVRNDAIFVISDLGLSQDYLFLLEIDRGTMPIQVSKAVQKTLALNTTIRSNVESKLLKIQKLLSVSSEIFPQISPQLAQFRGARVIVVTSSAQRVLNIIRKVPLHPELVKQQVFMFSYFEETSKGAFCCHYAVPVLRNGALGIETRAIRNILGS